MKPIFLRFLDELEVQYTKHYAISTYDEHPYTHTIYGLSSMLDKYSVSNVALNLNDKEELLKLQTPFIAQVTEDIVIVKSVSKHAYAKKTACILPYSRKTRQKKDRLTVHFL